MIQYLFTYFGYSTDNLQYLHDLSCVFTVVDDTSESDSEIDIPSRSTVEFNRADTVVHHNYLFYLITYKCVY